MIERNGWSRYEVRSGPQPRRRRPCTGITRNPCIHLGSCWYYGEIGLNTKRKRGSFRAASDRGHLFLLRLSVRANDMTHNVLDLGDTMETRKNEKPNLMRLA